MDSENTKALTEAKPARRAGYGFFSTVFDAVSILVSSIMIISIVFTFVFRLVGVNGGSMDKTLKNGDWLLVTPYYTEPQYGDIVITSDEHPGIDTAVGRKENLVKRVIGLGGDVISIDFEGTVRVIRSADAAALGITDEATLEAYDKYELEKHFTALNETYVFYDGAKGCYGSVSYPLIVPEGCVMLMGDHRDNSHDSRYTDIGFFKYEELLGKAQIRLSGNRNIYSNFNKQ